MENFSAKKRIVIKIGSSLLVENGILRQKWLQEFAKDVAWLLARHVEVVVVSSGAIALGKAKINPLQKLTLPQKQAAAAVGQIELMAKYRHFFEQFQVDVAQILLTSDDCEARERYVNSQNTIETLLAKKIVPIINENDTVAVHEIKIGDNDRLAARVAQMISADLLILFSDVDGLYDKNPRQFASAKLLSEVAKITKEIEEMAGGSGSAVGTGGMITKIIAAKMATMSGCEALISNGLTQNPLQKLFLGEQNCTIFRSGKKGSTMLKSRKKRLAGFLKAKGEVVINTRACEALLAQKISLLPIGITKVFGDFAAGDLVFVKDESGNHIASGIANYNASDAKKVIGKNSSQAKELLEKSFKKDFIHIDNLILI